MILTQALIDKVRQQLEQLKQQTLLIDRQNASIQSDRFKYRDFFNQQLFRCDSTLLSEYVYEAEQNFNLLLKGAAQAAHLNALGEKLTDQIAALTQAIRANEVALKENGYQQKRRKTQNARRYKKVASQFMANSHQLHQELAQNHEFERRLNEMIFIRQAKMSNSQGAQAAQLEREILALHQRLGKCRRAITAVEERISWIDSKSG